MGTARTDGRPARRWKAAAAPILTLRTYQLHNACTQNGGRGAATEIEKEETERNALPPSVAGAVLLVGPVAHADRVRIEQFPYLNDPRCPIEHSPAPEAPRREQILQNLVSWRIQSHNVAHERPPNVLASVLLTEPT